MSDLPPPNPNDDTEQQPPTEKKPWWKRGWVIGLAVLLLIIIVATSGDETGSPEDEAVAPAEQEQQQEPEEEPEQITPAETTPPEEIEEQPEEEAAEEIVEATEEPAGPAFEPITMSGTGDDVVDVTMPADEPGIITLTHQGGANFAVVSYDPDGNRIDLLANVVGNYDGTRPVNFTGTEPVGQLEITADGAWTAEIRPLSEARSVDGTSVEGTGPDVVLIASVDASSAQAEHDGSANFAVVAWGQSRDLVINDIGAYSGRVRIPPGTIALDIEADGNWSFDFS